MKKMLWNYHKYYHPSIQRMTLNLSFLIQYKWNELKINISSVLKRNHKRYSREKKKNRRWFYFVYSEHRWNTNTKVNKNCHQHNNRHIPASLYFKQLHSTPHQSQEEKKNQRGWYQGNLQRNIGLEFGWHWTYN